jgi:hypothetical protein
MWRAPFWLILVILTCTGCNITIPQDPEQTLERIQGGVIRVGAVENEPWVIRVNDEATGVEAELVRMLATELDAEIEWIWGSEQEHMEALEHYKLDLAIGGLTQPTPWSNRVGFTSPYFETQIKVGIPQSAPLIDDIEDLEVAVKEGTVIASYVEAKDGIPAPVKEPSQAQGPVAAAEWELEDWGFTVTDIELHTEKHIIATSPGENAWLVRLEQFLRTQKSSIKRMLQQAEENPL